MFVDSFGFIFEKVSVPMTQEMYEAYVAKQEKLQEERKAQREAEKKRQDDAAMDRWLRKKAQQEHQAGKKRPKSKKQWIVNFIT